MAERGSLPVSRATYPDISLSCKTFGHPETVGFSPMLPRSPRLSDAKFFSKLGKRLVYSHSIVSGTRNHLKGNGFVSKRANFTVKSTDRTICLGQIDGDRCRTTSPICDKAIRRRLNGCSVACLSKTPQPPARCSREIRQQRMRNSALRHRHEASLPGEPPALGI